jgi:hypothetical protein
MTNMTDASIIHGAVADRNNEKKEATDESNVPIPAALAGLIVSVIPMKKP